MPETTSTGTQVVFTFIETNVSHKNVNVAIGPSKDGFIVSQNGKPVWQSNAGPQPEFLMLRTLQPGQSLTLQATWNDRSNLVNPPTPQEGSPLSGTFTVENELDRGSNDRHDPEPTTTNLTPSKPIRSNPDDTSNDNQSPPSQLNRRFTYST